LIKTGWFGKKIRNDDNQNRFDALSIYISKVTGISVRKFLLVLLTSLAAIGAQGRADDRGYPA
jgi:hypothetical protein